MKRLICAAVAVVAACAHAAAGAPEKKDRVAIVAAHPDDLIACIGFCLMTTNLFEVHVIDYTHGERGLGPERFKDGSTKRIRTQEESSVCAALGAKLHWLDEIDGEAFAGRETCERLAALFREIRPRAVIAHWPVDIHGDHAMSGVASLKAVFLAGLDPEICFMDQVYQSKNFTPDVYVDFTPVADRKWELVRLYACQNREGGMERRLKDAGRFNAMRSNLLIDGYAEAFTSFVKPLAGAKSIFDELPPPRFGLRLQGAK